MPADRSPMISHRDSHLRLAALFGIWVSSILFGARVSASAATAADSREVALAFMESCIRAAAPSDWVEQEGRRARIPEDATKCPRIERSYVGLTCGVRLAIADLNYLEPSLKTDFSLLDPKYFAVGKDPRLGPVQYRNIVTEEFGPRLLCVSEAGRDLGVHGVVGRRYYVNLEFTGKDGQIPPPNVALALLRQWWPVINARRLVTVDPATLAKSAGKLPAGDVALSSPVSAPPPSRQASAPAVVAPTAAAAPASAAQSAPPNAPQSATPPALVADAQSRPAPVAAATASSQPKSNAAAPKPASLAGRWNWSANGTAVTIRPDGTLSAANGQISGKWYVLHEEKHVYRLEWEPGGIDTVILADDGNSLSCTSLGNRVPVTRRRIE